MACSMKVWATVVAGTSACLMLPLCGCDDPSKHAQRAGQGENAPTDTKPSTQPNAKPDRLKPDEPKAEAPKIDPSKINPPLSTEDVTIKGKDFKLELAVNPDTRFRGLTGRTSIDPEGGMLFVFPRPTTTSFVMRDCPVAIDIIYLDGSGRVLESYKMTPEPRRESESDAAYEARLKKYPSNYDAQYVIELKGNTLDTLGVKKGDKIKLDFTKLKKMAK